MASRSAHYTTFRTTNVNGFKLLISRIPKGRKLDHLARKQRFPTVAFHTTSHHPERTWHWMNISKALRVFFSSDSYGGVFESTKTRIRVGVLYCVCVWYWEVYGGNFNFYNVDSNLGPSKNIIALNVCYKLSNAWTKPSESCIFLTMNIDSFTTHFVDSNLSHKFHYELIDFKIKLGIKINNTNSLRLVLCGTPEQINEPFKFSFLLWCHLPIYEN